MNISAISLDEINYFKIEKDFLTLTLNIKK
jgi:hypothetical protein